MATAVGFAIFRLIAAGAQVIFEQDLVHGEMHGYAWYNARCSAWFSAWFSALFKCMDCVQ
jgi:hypothetical protein